MIQFSFEQNLVCLIIVHPNLRMWQKKKSINSERKSHCFSEELEFNLLPHAICQSRGDEEFCVTFQQVITRPAAFLAL